MKENSFLNFGLIISYLLPGFTFFWGLSLHSVTLASWISTDQSSQPTVGGFFFVTLLSLTIGLIIGMLRWMIIDTVHHLTGIQKPFWDYRQLQNKIQGFQRLVEDHYNYYKFYSGMFLAGLFCYISLWFNEEVVFADYWIHFCFVLIESALLIASRDTLRNYYQRVASLLAG